MEIFDVSSNREQVYEKSEGQKDTLINKCQMYNCSFNEALGIFEL